MYNYSGLWIRLIWLCILCFLGFIVIFSIRKIVTGPIKIIGIVLIIGLFMFSIFYCLPSIIKPNINCIEGTYIGNARITGVSPFQYEYCFEKGDKKYYIDMDAFSRKNIYPNDLIVGEKYVVYYEKAQNIIVRIINKTGDG